MYANAARFISNTSFFNDCCNFFDCQEDKIKEAVNSLKSNNHDFDLMIIKICRLYNMRLKLGHSARITYIAKSELDSMDISGNIDTNNLDLFRSTVILSALLHDIGRFYQAINYNTLSDPEMKRSEKKIGDLSVDHAVAGYYYAIASFLELHKLSNESSDAEKARFIKESIAAFVVKMHQQSNNMINYYDYTGGADVLNSASSDLIYNFIDSMYDNAKLMNYSVSFDEQHKAFIDAFISKIKDYIGTKNIDYSIASGFNFDSSLTDELYNKLREDISVVLKSANLSDVNKISSDIVNVMNNNLKGIANNGFDEEFEEQIHDEIVNLLSNMLNYDIAASIDNEFKNNSNIADIIKFYISRSLYMTMDADKIDILNQWASGLYNSSCLPETYEIFPVEGRSLKDMLNEFFKFNINEGNFEIDNNLLCVLNSMSSDVLKGLESYLSEFNIFEKKNNKLKIKNNIFIRVDDCNVIINDNSDIRTYNSSKFKDLFNNEWIGFLCDNCGYERLPFSEFKSKYYAPAQISVSNDILESNVSFLSDDEIVEVYKKLLVSDSLRDRFMLYSDNPIGSGWIKKLDDHDSSHLVGSSVSGLIWQLNQFLFVNMRNVDSYKFILDNNLLDKIYEQYEKKAPVIAKIIKEYIDYSKKFIDRVLVNRDVNLSSERLEMIREELYNESNNVTFSDEKTSILK